jgi:hypothetical protein
MKSPSQVELKVGGSRNVASDARETTCCEG